MHAISLLTVHRLEATSNFRESQAERGSCWERTGSCSSPIGPLTCWWAPHGCSLGLCCLSGQAFSGVDTGRKFPRQSIWNIGLEILLLGTNGWKHGFFSHRKYYCRALRFERTASWFRRKFRHCVEWIRNFYLHLYSRVKSLLSPEYRTLQNILPQTTLCCTWL